MTKETIRQLYNSCKEDSLVGRYLEVDQMDSLIDKLSGTFKVDVIGHTVNGKTIKSITAGKGNKKVLIWSQMHGNETTTTKAVFDLLNTLADNHNQKVQKFLDNLSICIIPVLNVDGAYVYTRENANKIDLNRDALNLSQPESQALRKVFDDLGPDFCFNLHGQRTIFSAGKVPHPATISFLSPAQDEVCSITPNRKVAMAIINDINNSLQRIIPNSVGIYDDSYNPNCVGDYFQRQGVPTILVEAGHFPGDYYREYSRYLIYHSYLTSLNSISNNSYDIDRFDDYFDIPNNEKLFYDIIIRNARISRNEQRYVDVAVQFVEKLEDGRIKFVPRIEKIERLNEYFGHREINATGNLVLGENNQPLIEGNLIDFVLINNELLSLRIEII